MINRLPSSLGVPHFRQTHTLDKPIHSMNILDEFDDAYLQQLSIGFKRAYLKFSKIGVPPNYPFIDRFSIINHPFGVSPFMETPHMFVFCQSRIILVHSGLLTIVGPISLRCVIVYGNK